MEVGEIPELTTRRECIPSSLAFQVDQPFYTSQETLMDEIKVGEATKYTGITINHILQLVGRKTKRKLVFLANQA